MNRYHQEVVGVEQEPIKPHVTERFEKEEVPDEGELRFLGNAWNYCGYFHKELKDCVEEGVKQGDTKLFKKCKDKLEQLHHCYSWREPTDYEYSEAFLKETSKCLFNRDLFLKCYFRQAEPWETCHPTWMKLYSCQYRTDPNTYNIF